MDIYEESLKMHRIWRGKIQTKCNVLATTKEELMLCYTPGVARSCLEIEKNPIEAYSLTRKWNSVAVISDGTAVLGLGDIGPVASLPVMEGKACLFKIFGDVDAVPVVLGTKDTDEIVRTIELISPTYGAINLEDISSPRCFEIERRLNSILDIPVFHDDQHGTAIVVGAALINALKLAEKAIDDIKIVISGAGAAGISIAEFLIDLGAKNIVLVDKFGIVNLDNATNDFQKKLVKYNKSSISGTLADAIRKSDVFIGVSAPNIVTKEMICSMNDKKIVFPLANPVPEISREDCIQANAFIVGTGSSQYPNQINNLLAFPGIFRGALDARAKKITKEMMLAAAFAIADTIEQHELSVDNIIPAATLPEVHKNVSLRVFKASFTEK